MHPFRTALHNYRDAASCLAKHWALLIIACITDLAFIYLLAKKAAQLFTDSSTELEAVNKIIQAKTSSISSPDFEPSLLSNAEFMTHYQAFLKLLLLLLFFVLVYWFVGQLVSWYVAHRIAGSKIRPLPYFAKFTAATLAGYAGFIAIILGSAWLSYKSYLDPFPLFGQKTVTILTVVFMLVLLWVLGYGYAAAAHKNALRLTLKTAFSRAGLLTYLIGLAAIAILYFGLSALQGVYFLYPVVFGLLLGLPLLTLIRVAFVAGVGDATNGKFIY
ncbi:hypothetical protein HY642_05405 [Candidatus Woesearchaeota archaeon]|nr:hypothetical protein [Candidatus Woesearchaeota archaeon]